MKKTISLILALALIVSMLPSAAFAADSPSASLSVDKTSIKAGEEITVTVNLDTAIENVMLAEFYVHYDTSLFTRGEATVGTALTGTQVSTKNVATDGKELKNDGTDAAVQKFSINTFAYPSGYAGTPGAIATITFTAKEDAAAGAAANFKLEYNMMQDKDFTDIAVEAIGDVTVTVGAPDPAYTVTLGEDQSVVAGEAVEVPITVGHTTDVTAYNAFDMTFTYDPAVLELSSTQIEGLTVTPGEGTVRVQGYGADRAVGTAPFSLGFVAVGTGSSNVTVTSARVDVSANAIDKDAPEAVIADDTTVVTVSGYSVTLPEGFTGDAVTAPGKDYTFTEPEDYYDYDITVTVGGKDVQVTDNGDGSYTIPGESVTDEIVVTASKTGKTFPVTLGSGLTGPETAQYMTDYSATLSVEEGYTYEVTVTIGGKDYTGFAIADGVYTIPGEDITGEVVFTVTKTEIPAEKFTVTFQGSAAGSVVNAASEVEEGANYVFGVRRSAGYDNVVTATMGGEAVDVVVAGTNGDALMYRIENVTGDLVITVEKTATYDIGVSTYVELDGKTLFLVTASGAPEGKTFFYEGNAMFYSESYESWCYLVVVEGSALTEADAVSKVKVTDSSYTTLTATSDVNMSGLVDINDAQLVYDIYNGMYEDFSVVVMQKFLNADVNGDKVVNVTDAAAVVAAIQ